MLIDKLNLLRLAASFGPPTSNVPLRSALSGGTQSKLKERPAPDKGTGSLISDRGLDFTCSRFGDGVERVLDVRAERGGDSDNEFHFSSIFSGN